MSFKKSLETGNSLLGTLLTIPEPAVAEVLSKVGLDWVFIDAEHSSMSSSDVLDLLRALGESCYGLVRVAENSDVEIKKALDAGADGVIVPLVNTKAEAEKAVLSAKFPPMGTRSVGIGRAQKYGLDLPGYIARSNDITSVIVQIEHIDAVRNIEEILTVEGIDGIFIGPFDLSGSMGKIGEIDDEEVKAAIQDIYDAATRHEVPVGCFVPTSTHAEAAIKAGAKFVAIGAEVTHLISSLQKTLDALGRRLI